MTNPTITTYSAHFAGTFGKKRTAQAISTDSPWTTLEGARNELLRKARPLKVGTLTITRYDNCEQLEGGTIILPITQGVIVERIAYGLPVCPVLQAQASRVPVLLQSAAGYVHVESLYTNKTGLQCYIMPDGRVLDAHEITEYVTRGIYRAFPTPEAAQKAL